MKYEELSREELIQVLNELSKAYEALKEHYEKDSSLLREAEMKIYRSEEKFRKAFFTSPDSVNINRMSDGLYVSINEGFTRITGYTEDEVIGKTSIELNIWADPEKRKELVKLLQEKGKVENFEALFRKKDGTLVWGLMSASILDIEGEPHILNVTRDITDIKRIQEELSREKNLIRTIIDSVPDRIYAKDRDGRFILCNQALVKRFNKNDVSEVLGKTDYDFLTYELANQFHNDEQKIINTGEPLVNHEESRGIIDGMHRWNLVTKVPLRDSTGNIIGIVGIGRDITEIKRRELESQVLFDIIKGISVTTNLDELLRLIHEALKKVVSAENCFVALHDPKTGLFSFPYFVDKYDKNPGLLSLEKSCTSYVFRTNQPLFLTRERFSQLLNEGEIEQIGTPSPSWIGVPLNSPAGTIGVLVLQNYEQENVYSEDDIKFLTSIGRQIAFAIERKMAEEEIRVKNEMLQAVNAEKDKFFSIVAHDLRGPLSAFMEATKILTEEIQNMSYEEIREISGELNKEASRIYGLLENLLEWSRIQRDVIKYEPFKQNLASLVNNAVAPLLSSAGKKNISVEIYIQDNIQVFADSHMIETTIRNLVSNAIKFTPGGKIVITAEDEGEETIKISVKDSGIGIPHEMINNLFSLTAKVNRPGTDGEPSTGLGLLLCKEFVEKHGGKIWVESEVGKGTTFHFTIPGKSTLLDN